MSKRSVAARIAAVLAVSVAAVACGDHDSSTDLHPEGPPMVEQVFVQERIISEDTSIERFQLAFGTHPDIPTPEEDPILGDDGAVTNAIAGPTAKIRVVMDELIRGNALEEIACNGLDPAPAASIPDDQLKCPPPGAILAGALSSTSPCLFSKVPVEADPDDIAHCSGPDQTHCALDLCVDGTGTKVGVLDVNQDGASDAVRMIDYGAGELAVSLVCDGTSVPLNRSRSFYNPEGNQQMAAVDDYTQRLLTLGPAIILYPRDGMKTSADCTLTFRPEVVDKDGNQVCAPPGGDIEKDCSPGDTSAIQFTVEPLALFGGEVNGVSLDPAEPATDVPLNDGSADATISLQFITKVDPDTIDAITLEDDTGPVTFTPMVSPSNAAIVTLTVTGGLDANTPYTITIGTGLTDQFGGALPAAITLMFTTGAA